MTVKIKISTKIMAVFTLLMVSVSGIFVFTLYTILSGSLRRELLDKIISNANSEAVQLVDFVISNDKDAITNYIFSEKYSRKEMAYLVLQEENGDIVGTMLGDKLKELIEMNALGVGQKQDIRLITGNEGEKIYNITIRLPYDKGVLFSGYYEKPINDAVREITWVMSTTMAGAILVGGLLVWFLVRKILKPLKKLKKTIGLVAAGNIKERADIRTLDEIGYFAENFNGMLDNLEKLEKDKLSQEGKKYIDLIDNTPLCIKVFDQNGKLSFINKGGREEHFLGENEDVGNWDWLNTIKENYRAEARNKFDRAYSFGESSRFILEHTQEGSRRQWCSEIITPLKDEAGKIRSVLMLSNDITQLKKTEEELERSAALFRTLLDSMPYCIKWYDGHGKLISINRHGKAEHYLNGKSEEEIRAWHFAEGVKPEFKDSLGEAMKNATLGQPTELDVRHYSEACSAEWTHNSFVPVIEKNEVKYILMISRNVTEEKKLEEERSKDMARIEETKKALYNILEDVKESERNLQTERDRSEAIVSAMGEGLAVIGKNSRIILMNRKGEEILGISRGQLIGMNYGEVGQFIRGEQAISGEELISKIFDKGEQVTVGLADNLYYYCRVSDKKFPIEMIGSPMKSGADLAAVIVFQDITKLKELDEAKSSFISIASHQLRTPLTSIRWYAELLSSTDSGTLNDDQKDFVDRVYSGALKLAETINLLLAMARIESGKTKFETTDVNLEVEVSNILRELEPTIKQKNLNITVKKAVEKIPVIKFDAAGLRQAVSNLLTNSIRYTDKDGHIEIGITPREGEILFSVKDDGIGIPEIEKDRIFDKFFRAGNAVSKVPDGSGLGLALVKNLVGLWRGKIWFESPISWNLDGKEQKKGTAFYFTMPF